MPRGTVHLVRSGEDHHTLTVRLEPQTRQRLRQMAVDSRRTFTSQLAVIVDEAWEKRHGSNRDEPEAA